MKRNVKDGQPSEIHHRRKYGFPGLTLTAWAINAGMNPQTMEKMFRKQGVQVEARRLYGVRDFLVAVTGDKHAAEVQKLELEGRRLRREEEIADGSLVEWSLVEKQVVSFANSLISAMDAAPDTVSREWVEKVMKPAVRMQLQKPKAE
jgi:hypothetical protein